jgi:hypothetical protein
MPHVYRYVCVRGVSALPQTINMKMDRCIVYVFCQKKVDEEWNEWAHGLSCLYRSGTGMGMDLTSG